MNRLVRAIKDREYKAYADKGIINLGELINLLEGCRDLNKPVLYADGKKPSFFCSWRGDYESLCLVDSSDDTAPCKNGAELLQKAKEAPNKIFFGYKGGKFKMTKKTQIHRADAYAEAGKSFLSGVKEMPNAIFLVYNEDV